MGEFRLLAHPLWVNLLVLIRLILYCGRSSAQRIASLAVGVSTESLDTTHDPYAVMSDVALAAELQRLGIDPTEPTLR
jgi:hypothetical protein